MGEQINPKFEVGDTGGRGMTIDEIIKCEIPEGPYKLAMERIKKCLFQSDLADRFYTNLLEEVLARLNAPAASEPVVRLADVENVIYDDVGIHKFIRDKEIIEMLLDRIRVLAQGGKHG